MSATVPRKYVAAGTAGQGTTSAVAYALPAGISAGYILYLLVESDTTNLSITNANGGTWTLVGQNSVTGSTGYLWWSRYNGTQGNPTVGAAADHQDGRIVAYTGLSTETGDPYDAHAVGGEDVSDTSWAIAGLNTSVDGTLVAGFVTRADDSSSAHFSAWTNSDLASVTERLDGGSTSGNGGGYGSFDGYDVVHGTVGTTSVTNATATTKNWIVVSMPPMSVDTVCVRQEANYEASATGTTGAAAFTFNVLAGSSIVAYVEFFASSNTIGISDSLNGSVYGSAQNSVTDSTDGYTAAQYKFDNSAAGAVTVNVTYNPTVQYRCVHILEIANTSGMASGGHAGQQQATPGTSADGCTSGNMTVAAGNNLILGMCGDYASDTAPTAGTGFTATGAAFNNQGTTTTLCESKRVTSGTSLAATFTSSVNDTHITLGMVFVEALSAATTANCAETGGTAATEASSSAQVQTSASAETGATAATEASTVSNADAGAATTAACADTSTAAATEAATSTQAQSAACAETGATAATEASTGTTGAVPTTGAHTLAHNSVGDSGTTTVTTTLTTQTIGSTFIASTGLGTDSAMQLPTDNKGNTPYSWIEAAITEYIDWPGSGIRGAVFLSGAGGSGHTFTAHRSSGDECSLAVVEVKNGGVLKDHQVSRPTTSPATSPSVATTEAATLVCILWGGGQSATNLTPDAGSIAAGWSRIEFYNAGDSSSIQCAIAVRDVSGQGTYSCTWTLSPSQNSICEIFAIQAPATSATTASCAETASSAATEASTSAEANGAACPQVATAAAGESATSTQTIGASCAEQSLGVSAESASATAVSTASCAETASSAATEAATASSPAASSATCAETSATAATESATASNLIASTAVCAEVSSVAATESATAAPSLGAYVNEVASAAASESATGAQSQACNSSETSTSAATEAGVSAQAQAATCPQVATAAPSEAATISNLLASSANCAEVASTAATEANTAREANTASCSETATTAATEAGVASNLIALNVYCAEVSTAAASEASSSTQSLSIACAQIASAAAAESSSAVEPQNANITERGDTAATEMATTLASGRADVSEIAATAAAEAAQGTSQNAAVCIEASSIAATDSPLAQQLLAANCSEHPSSTASETSTASQAQQATAPEVSQVAASEQAIAQNAVSYNAYCAEVSQVAASEAVTASASITASCAQTSVGIATQTSIAAQNQAIACNELSSGQSVDAASLINVWAATEANVYQQAYAVALERSDVLQYAFAQCSEDALTAAVERARCTLGNVVYDVRKFSLLIASKRERLSDAAVSRSRFSDVAPRDVLSEPVKGS